MTPRDRREYEAPHIAEVGSIAGDTLSHGRNRGPGNQYDGYSNAKRIGHSGDFWFTYQDNLGRGSANRGISG